jgi:cell division protein FtsA
MENKLITAIDIGTTKIVVVRGRSISDNKVEIVDISKTVSTGVERGIVQNAEKTAKAIQKALEQLKTKHLEPIENVWVGIAGQHVRSLKSSTSLRFEKDDHEITFEDIERLCEDSFNINTKPGELVVNVAAQSYEANQEITSQAPIGQKAGNLSANFHLTIAQESAFNNISKSLDINNIDLNEPVLESIASAKSVLSKEEIKQGIVLVDIGGGTSDLAIFSEGRVVHSAVIPFGGEAITGDIIKTFKVDHRYAEALKHEYGYLLEGDLNKDQISLKNADGQKIKIKQKDLSHVIKSRVEEIIDLIQFQVELSGYANKIPKGIVLTGGGSLLKDLTQLFAFHFNQASIRIGKPNRQFFSSTSDSDYNCPTYSTSTGLLIIGIEMEKAKQRELEIKAQQQEKVEEKVEKEDPKEEKGNAFGFFRERLKNMFNEEDQEL